MLGLGQRSAPNVTDQFKEECRRRGIKPSDALATALKRQVEDWGLTAKEDPNRKIIEVMDASTAVVQMADTVNKLCTSMSQAHVQNAELIAKLTQSNMIEPLSADLDSMNIERKKMLSEMEEKAEKIKQLDEVLEKRRVLARSQGIDPDAPIPKVPVMGYNLQPQDSKPMTPEERRRLLEKMRKR